MPKCTRSICQTMCTAPIYHWVSCHIHVPHPLSLLTKYFLLLPVSSCIALLYSTQTKWFGSRKFAIPSLMANACPQFPHIKLPSLICVSSNKVCNSCVIFSFCCNSSTVGAVAGRGGNPNYFVTPSQPLVFSSKERGMENSKSSPQ